jgi:hypothetical protein
MYQTRAVAGTALGTLPFTGLNLTWTVLAAFALLAAGGALMRIAPRRRRRHG